MCGKRGVDGEEEHGKKKREGLKKKQPGRQKAQGVFIESVKLCQTPLEIKKKGYWKCSVIFAIGEIINGFCKKSLREIMGDNTR